MADRAGDGSQKETGEEKQAQSKDHKEGGSRQWGLSGDDCGPPDRGVVPNASYVRGAAWGSGTSEQTPALSLLTCGLW